MVTDVYVKFYYDRLRIDKALEEIFDNNKDKNNVGSARGYLRVQKNYQVEPLTQYCSDVTFNIV